MLGLANKGHLGYAATLCMRAVDLLYEAHGGPDAPGFDRLQRAWRDSHCVARPGWALISSSATGMPRLRAAF